MEFGFPADAARRKSRRLASTTYTPSGAYLVLQLHDELIYEVCISKGLFTLNVSVSAAMTLAILLSWKAI